MGAVCTAERDENRVLRIIDMYFEVQDNGRGYVVIRNNSVQTPYSISKG